MEQNPQLFLQNKYCIVNSAISKETASIAEIYAIIDEKNNFSPEGANLQVPNAHSKYADTLMESILIKLLPTVEKNTGIYLYPTYSYYRVYRNGDELKPHTDRFACEISATLCIGYNYEDSRGTWPIIINNNKISMNIGDMIIYRGIEVNHYREKFYCNEDAYHVQCFLHYVDKNGPYSEWKLDKRSQIGSKK